MAALTPVASVEALISAIEKSGLLSPGGMEKAREAAAKASEPKALARDLVKSGVLTRWQAEQLINGYHRLLVGNYKLLDQIGTSPTGRLYLAEHAQMGRRHTLKVLARRLASNSEAVKHFLESARNACRLDHRNVSHVYDVNQDRIGHYVVMEYVEGQNLEDLIERTGRVTVEQAIDFVRQAAEGLAHAHVNGVVHGDLKPANLLRDHSGTIKILEIGQAEFGAKPETEDADESVETASLAAVIFQAPELRGDGEAATIACDVYSIGSVFCFLLTAKAAKDAAAALKLLESVPETAPETIAFCQRLMAEKPQERPASMETVLAEIGALGQQLAAAAKAKADEKTLPDVASLKQSPKNEKWKKGGDGAQKEKKPLAAQSTPVQLVAVQSVAVQPIEATQPGAAQSVAAQPVVATQPSAAQPAAAAVQLAAVQPAAQAVEVGPVPAVLLAGVEPAKTPPAEPFVIKTKGRIKKPGKATTAKEDEQSSQKKDEKERWTPVYTPLVLAGAIGGGGVLMLGLGIAVICVISLRSASKSVAEGPKTTAVVAMQNAEGAAPAETEANPEAPAPADVNPEVTVAAPAEADPPLAEKVAVRAEPKATAKKEPESSAPATGNSASKAPANEVAAAEPKSSPAPEKKTEPAPNNPEPKAAAPEAKPVAAKPAAKPKAADPFAGFAKAVSLPELPDMPDAPSTTALSPIELGPCVADEKAKLTIGLLGGDTAIRTAKQKLELQPKADSGREWNFVLNGGAAPATIATLAAQDRKLMFQWTEEGVKQAALAKQLCNCVLALGDKRQIAALRMVERGAPLAVDIDKAGVSVKWNIGDLPLAKQIFVEVTRAEGFKIARKDPKTPVNVGEAVVVGTGPSENSVPLLFKLSTSSTANAVDIRLQTSVKLPGGGEARPYRKRDLVAMQPQSVQELNRIKSELDTTKAKRPTLQAEKDAQKAAVERLAGDLATINTLIDQLRYVVDFSGSTEGQARIHFRVYAVAGDAKVDLLRTEEEQPAEKGK